MNNSDKIRLSQALTTVGLTTGRNVDAATVNAFAIILDGNYIGDIENAIMAHMKDSSVYRPFPTPQDIIKRMQPDFDEIFDRLINRGKPKNEIEYAAWGNVGYACRTQLKEDVARLRFKSEYLRQVEISKQPRAPQTHRIESKPVLKETDKMVDDGVDKFKSKSPEEIKQMLRDFKNGVKVTKRTDGL